jgi:hypothetical protein
LDGLFRPGGGGGGGLDLGSALGGIARPSARDGRRAASLALADAWSRRASSTGRVRDPGERRRAAPAHFLDRLNGYADGGFVQPATNMVPVSMNVPMPANMNTPGFAPVTVNHTINIKLAWRSRRARAAGPNGEVNMETMIRRIDRALADRAARGQSSLARTARNPTSFMKG